MKNQKLFSFLILRSALCVLHSWPGTDYFFLFFAGFAVAAAGFFPVCESVITPPSASERLSSTSTVCVIASVPVGAGWPAAGAIVCVCAEPAAPALSRREHAVENSAKTMMTASGGAANFL